MRDHFVEKTIGYIFTALGFIFIVVGIMVGIAFHERDGFGWMFTMIFSGIGSVFFIIGIGFPVKISMDNRKRERLISDGYFIYAEISHIERDYHLEVNGRHPFVVVCRFIDEYGTAHMFRSKHLYFNPEGLLTNHTVRVYLDRTSWNHYYVDIDSILMPVTYH